MSTGKIRKNCIEVFFQAVSKGSVPNLQNLLKKHKPHEDEEAMIVNSFNSGGETVGIQNSTTTCLTRASDGPVGKASDSNARVPGSIPEYTFWLNNIIILLIL